MKRNNFMGKWFLGGKHSEPIAEKSANSFQHPRKYPPQRDRDNQKRGVWGAQGCWRVVSIWGLAETSSWPRPTDKVAGCNMVRLGENMELQEERPVLGEHRCGAAVWRQAALRSSNQGWWRLGGSDLSKCLHWECWSCMSGKQDPAIRLWSIERWPKFYLPLSAIWRYWFKGEYTGIAFLVFSAYLYCRVFLSCCITWGLVFWIKKVLLTLESEYFKVDTPTVVLGYFPAGPWHLSSVSLWASVCFYNMHQNLLLLFLLKELFRPHMPHGSSLSVMF